MSVCLRYVSCKQKRNPVIRGYLINVMGSHHAELLIDLTEYYRGLGKTSPLRHENCLVALTGQVPEMILFLPEAFLGTDQY